MAKTLQEWRDEVARLESEMHSDATAIRSLAEVEEISEEDDAKLTALLEERDAKLTELETARTELAPLEERSRKIEEARSLASEKAPGYHVPQNMRRVETGDLDVSRMNDQELRSAALKIVEDSGKRLTNRQLDHVDKTIRSATEDTDGALIARRMVITERDVYKSAFAKGVTDPQPKWNAEELRALEEFRAMSEGTNSAGGYGVPVLIDPSIILTAGAADAPVLDLARIVTITTNAWKGVASGAVVWSYDAEGSAVSDDSPTLSQPNVPVYAARGFIPYSLEVGMDYPGFAEEMAMLLSHGFLDLVASNTVTGSGASQPRGIFTALAADSTAEIITTTDGALGAIDFQNLYKGLPERYRANATWLMHTQVENAVRAFPTSSNFGYFTVDLSKDGIGVLQGRPVRTTDYAPQYTGTTLAANIAVFGDFSNFLVAQRAGMTVELVPHLFDVTNNRPTGQRGWFAYARHGFDSINNAGFKILVNT